MTLKPKWVLAHQDGRIWFGTVAITKAECLKKAKDGLSSLGLSLHTDYIGWEPRRCKLEITLL